MKTLLLLLIAFSFTPTESLSQEIKPTYKEAILAGGCFWCIEPPFDKLDGVVETLVGYTGGDLENPTYKLVSSGKTKHVESVLIKYDPKKIAYEKILDVYWRQIYPTDNKGQFVDRGPQYRPVIFYKDEKQKIAALASKKAIDESKRFDQPVLVDILPAKDFYAAEDYHQDYYIKNPNRYKFYRYNSGRDQYLKKIWKD